LRVNRVLAHDRFYQAGLTAKEGFALQSRRRCFS